DAEDGDPLDERLHCSPFLERPRKNTVAQARTRPIAHRKIRAPSTIWGPPWKKAPKMLPTALDTSALNCSQVGVDPQPELVANGSQVSAKNTSHPSFHRR